MRKCEMSWGTITNRRSLLFAGHVRPRPASSQMTGRNPFAVYWNPATTLCVISPSENLTAGGQSVRQGLQMSAGSCDTLVAVSHRLIRICRVLQASRAALIWRGKCLVQNRLADWKQQARLRRTRDRKCVPCVLRCQLCQVPRLRYPVGRRRIRDIHGVLLHF